MCVEAIETHPIPWCFPHNLMLDGKNLLLKRMGFLSLKRFPKTWKTYTNRTWTTAVSKMGFLFGTTYCMCHVRFGKCNSAGDIFHYWNTWNIEFRGTRTTKNQSIFTQFDSMDGWKRWKTAIVHVIWTRIQLIANHFIEMDVVETRSYFLVFLPNFHSVCFHQNTQDGPLGENSPMWVGFFFDPNSTKAMYFRPLIGVTSFHPIYTLGSGPIRCRMWNLAQGQRCSMPPRVPGYWRRLAWLARVYLGGTTLRCVGCHTYGCKNIRGDRRISELLPPCCVYVHPSVSAPTSVQCISFSTRFSAMLPFLGIWRRLQKEARIDYWPRTPRWRTCILTNCIVNFIHAA